MISTPHGEYENDGRPVAPDVVLHGDCHTRDPLASVTPQDIERVVIKHGPVKTTLYKGNLKFVSESDMSSAIHEDIGIKVGQTVNVWGLPFRVTEQNGMGKGITSMKLEAVNKPPAPKATHPYRQ